MYNFANPYGSSCGCNTMPAYTPCYYQGNNSNYAIILVLFILLVIVIGSRSNH